jgi:hypothetical protein
MIKNVNNYNKLKIHHKLLQKININKYNSNLYDLFID